MTVNTSMPEHAYSHWSILAALAGHVNGYLVAALTIATVVLARFGALFDAWQRLSSGKTLRIGICTLALTVAWPLVTYGYNHYFDQTHAIDRIAIVALFALTCWRPVFVLPFVAAVMAVMWQFAEPPLGGSIFAHKLQVLYPLMLFGAAFTLHAVTGQFPKRAFFVLLASMVAAAYWAAAWSKLGLDWTTSNQLHLIVPAAYNHGWLATLSASDIGQIAATLAPFDVWLQAIVMALEAACLVILIDRRLAVLLLAALAVFHTAVFVMYGFLFWTWIAVDCVLIALILRMRPRVFRPTTALIGVPLIALGSYWAHTPALGWLDTRVGYTYEVSATDANGQQWLLAPDYFAPYADTFTMQGFSYLSPHAVLTGPYAVAHDHDLAVALNDVRDRAALEHLESGHPASRHEARAAGFARFVAEFVTNRNAGADRLAWQRWIAPPAQFWGGPRPRDDGAPVTGTPPPVPITEVAVTEIVTVFGERGHEVLRRVEVEHIPIGPGRGSGGVQ